MTRLIDADALKKHFPKDVDWEAPVNTNEYVCECIDNAPTIEPFEKIGVICNENCGYKPQGEWIPVSERLPEESLNSVIGWDAYRERCVFIQYIDGHFQITGNNESFNIVAWRPLPEPYKKGGAE